MAEHITRRVFVAMLREEWRLHSRRFSGRRFALFPALIALLVGGAVQLLRVTGTPPGVVFAGLFGLAFLFGLHTGSIGLVGHDWMEDVIGDLTLLVFSARSLPLSERRLLGIFVAKDVVYYALLFLAPLTVGAAPVLIGLDGIGGVASLPAMGLWLWLTLTGAFLLGLGATLAGIGLTSHGSWGIVILAVSGAALATLWVLGIPVWLATPYGLFLDPTPPRFAATLLVLGGVLGLGGCTFEVTVRRGSHRGGRPFAWWARTVDDPVAAKTLLDLHRSSGGIGKVLFSTTLLLGVTVGLVDLAGRITGVDPSIGLSYGAVLGLSGVMTYTWLTQVDDIETYLFYPLDVRDVLHAKFVAFLFVGPLVALVTFGVAVAWQGADPVEAVVGAGLLVGVAVYIFGVTSYLTGLSPNEFLFDISLFAVFGASMIVPLVPILVGGLALASVPPWLLAGLGATAMGLGGTGYLLYRRAIPKWTRRYRDR